MKPPYEDKKIIGDCVLYLGDSKKILPWLADQMIFADCIVCDPPYLLTSGGATPGGMHERMGKRDGKKYDNSGKLVACEIDWKDFMPLFSRVLNWGHAYVMTNAKNMRLCLNAAHDAKFKLHNILDWNKKTATANRWYMKNLEFTCLFYRGTAKSINDCGSMAGINLPNTEKETDHPTEKPVALMQMYVVNSTARGQTVFDPFMGTGATAVACAKTGRKFVGIEIDKEWFDVTCDRVEKAYRHVQAPLI